MSDDLVPEEGKQAYNQLLSILRSSSQRRVPIAAREQAQIVAQVQERLAQAASSTTLSEVGVFTPPREFGPRTPTRQTNKPARLATNLLAALVVAGLILGSWTLFKAYLPSKGAPASSSVSRPGPVAQTQVEGLEASMRVLIGGPYFLSELLPIDVSFTNHTPRSVGLDGTFRIVNNSVAGACFPSALLVQVTQGNNPSYLFPQLEVACTQPYVVTEVAPGQMITIHQYVPLIKSGEITLARGVSPSDHTGNPSNRQWPTVHIQVQVSSQIPQERALSLLNQGGQVMIGVPAGAQAHLLYMQGITCDGYSLGGPSQWTPLSTNVLHQPACPTAHRHWTYIVSAPGYAIASGSQTT